MLVEVLNREHVKIALDAGKVCQESISKKAGIGNANKRL